jgi:tripartite ATP-independent transporter DctP family solute receptor
MTSISNRRTVLKGMVAAGFATAVCRPAFAQTKSLRLSHHLAPGHLVDIASKRFAELVAEGTGGAVKVEIFPSAQIAGLRQAAEAVQLGTVDLVWSDMGTLANWKPEYGFTNLPFIFANDEHFDSFFGSDSGKALAEDVKAQLGIEVLGWGNAGFRVIATREKAVNGPADLQGLRIRVPEIPVFVQTFEAVKANPTPMAWGEVYTALQTGVIDAVENPAEGLVNGAMQEVTKHLSRTYHILTDVNLLANPGMLDGLPEDQAAVIREAAATAVTEFNVATRENSKKNWDILAKTMTVVDEPDRAAFQQAMSPVWDNFISRTGDAGKNWVDQVAAAAAT